MAMVFASSALASVWTGGGANNYWATGGNWQENAMPGWLGTATFTGSSGVPNPDINGGAYNGISLDFQSAGWTISDSVGTGAIRVDGGTCSIKSAGAGVNHINANIGGSGTNALSMNIGSGNTLRISKGFAQSRYDFGSSSGTLVFDGSVLQGSTGSTMTNKSSLTILANTTGSGALQYSSYRGETGSRLGGTGTIQGYQYGITTIASGATLAPGGNGAFGDEIGTLTIKSSSATIRHNVVLDAGAVFEAQLGAMLGSNDKLVLNSYGNGFIDIKTGVTLSLLGDGAIEDGAYTIMANLATDMKDITGTFSTVLYNGQAIDPEHFTVDYLGDSIVVNVLGVIPEPATIGMLGLGALVTLLIRRFKV